MKTKKKQFVLQAKVFAALRKVFKSYPPYKETLDECKEEYFEKSKHGKDLRRVHYRCSSCKEFFKKPDFVVDHIEPVIPVEGLPQRDGLPDFNVYAVRLFCEKENLQGLCKTCHDKKSKAENKDRRDSKKRVAEDTE
jgi:5-methylcytosine-specific restriction endonuclease McrA